MSYVVFLYKSGPTENPVKGTVMQIIKVQGDDGFNMKSKSWKFRFRSFYDSRVMYFCSFMFWNKSDHKKLRYSFLNCMAAPLNFFRKNLRKNWPHGSFYPPEFGLR